ncbi:hypothetical protein KGF54_003957 [Candida jiufengensis]|uniref:uncharacterized protein n=1 Tax=Candida jiufengensis TaxID=497108 RepID=UPI0022248DD0|nr:uncharacterized protein KGF54_003957 [Candida jiufengensis]KAI5950883.1 hypothetical protein KGF54_003957 [Candida jiufengensis]
MPNIQRVGDDWDISIEFDLKDLNKYMIASPNMEFNIELILNGKQLFENKEFLKRFANCFKFFLNALNYNFEAVFNTRRSITFILNDKINYQSIPNKKELQKLNLKISLIGSTQINFKILIKELNELLVVWLSDLDLKCPLIFSKILRENFKNHLGKNNYNDEYKFIKDIVNNHKSTTSLFNLSKNPKYLSLVREYNVSPILNILQIQD